MEEKDGRKSKMSKNTQKHKEREIVEVEIDLRSKA